MSLGTSWFVWCAVSAQSKCLLALTGHIWILYENRHRRSRFLSSTEMYHTSYTALGGSSPDPALLFLWYNSECSLNPIEVFHMIHFITIWAGVNTYASPAVYLQYTLDIHYILWYGAVPLCHCVEPMLLPFHLSTVPASHSMTSFPLHSLYITEP